MVLNDDVSELKDSIQVNITPKMRCQVTLSDSVRCRLQFCVQSGGQHFEHLCEVANYILGREGHQLAFLLARYV